MRVMPPYGMQSNAAREAQKKSSNESAPPATAEEGVGEAVATLRVQVLRSTTDVTVTDHERVFITVRVPGIRHPPCITPPVHALSAPGWDDDEATFNLPVTHTWFPELEEGIGECSSASPERMGRKRWAMRALIPRRATTYIRHGASAGVRAVRRPIRLRSRSANAPEAPILRAASPKTVDTPRERATDALLGSGPASSVEFVVWKSSASVSERTYLGECCLPVEQWGNAATGDVTWASAQPTALPIVWAPAVSEPSDELVVRCGFVPPKEWSAGDADHYLNQLHRALCVEDSDGETLSLHHIPATDTVGMSLSAEDVIDDGLTASDSDGEATSDVSMDVDENASSGLSAGDDRDDDSDGDAAHTLRRLSLRSHSAAEVADVQAEETMRERAGHLRALSVGSAEKNGVPEQQAVLPALSSAEMRAEAAHVALSDTASDADAVSAPLDAGEPSSESERRRWRRLRLHPLRSRSGSSASSMLRPQRRVRRRRGGPREFAYKAAAGRDVVGVAMIEVVCAQNLPRWRNMTYTSFDMDPFTIVSFNRRIFRTRVCRHTLNPVWREKLHFHVRRSETNFRVKFAVYDWDSMSANDYVGEAEMALHMLLQRGEQEVDRAAEDSADASKTHDLATDEPEAWQTFQLPLVRQQHDEAAKFGAKQPKLTVRALYRPYEALRQRFWGEMFRLYDMSDTGGLDAVELHTMLQSLGSTLSADTLRALFAQVGKNANTDELTFAEAVQLLQQEIHRPLAQRRPQSEPELDDEPDAARASVERVIRLQSCPLCNMPRLSNVDEMDILTHLALCASQDWRALSDISMSSFVTARQAQRKWYTNVLNSISKGHYRVGANNANILVQDRVSGELVEEKMQVYVRLGIRLLYQGAKSHMAGARVRRMLRTMSVKQGAKFDHPSSTRSIAPFVAFHGINLVESVEPMSSFRTFNEFFHRRICMELRPVANRDDPRTMVSCADCRLMAFADVVRATQLWVKGRQFSIEKLLGSKYARELPDEAHSLFIFRLAPQDYHRFHCPVDALVGAPEYIAGEYYTVNPMAIRSIIDVYGENVRVVIPLYSKLFGTVYAVAIGAMMVGSTVLAVEEGQAVQRGDELGYFKFGGSTIVLVVPEARVTVDDDLLSNSEACIETLIHVGMRIGRAKDAGHRAPTPDRDGGDSPRPNLGEK
ncbi:phosphatidylserine decarboxylase [Malassezia sp. CBS 17886]|nr:phosphatidylserine decarboxylase [Malassezia sp. CBS 17886]